MNKVVRIGHERTFLGELLGQGAMADVYIVPFHGQNQAGKIYRYDDPEKEPMRAIRARKIPMMVKMDLPGEIFPPLEVISDPETGEFLGFTMDLIPAGCINFGELYAPSYWGPNFITPAKVLKIMRSLYAFIKKVHAKNLIIVDLNPGNILFNLGTNAVFGCDADSYQIPRFNGMEVHLDYASPRTRGVNLVTGEFSFLPGDDWWSFYIHFLTGITKGGHPFRGKGKWFKGQKKRYPTVPERVAAGLSIFDERVQPAGQAFPIEILPEEVLVHLHQVLVVNKRTQGPMPEWILDIQFRKCPLCGEEIARKQCPYCAKIIFVPSVAPMVRLIRETVLETKTPIAGIHVTEELIIAVLRQEDYFEVISISLENKAIQQRQRIELEINPALEYFLQIGDQLIGISDHENLYVFDFSGKLVEKTTTTRFLGKPIFAISDKLYRGVGSAIMAWESVQGRRVYQSKARVLPGATWFAATTAGLVYMVYADGRYQWTLLQGTAHIQLDVQPLKAGQRLVKQLAVAESDQALVILRLVEHSDGTQITLVDKYDITKGEISSYHFGDPIIQASFIKGKLVFAHDEGVMQWDLEHEPTVMPETENVASSGDRVLFPNRKILVIGKATSIDVLRSAKSS